VSSQAEIANLTAVLIGDESVIVSLDDNRTLARTLKSVWDAERRATLRDGSWNFAAKRAQLAASADAVAYPFQNAFPLPADCLRLIEVFEQGLEQYTLRASQYSDQNWQLEGGMVLADTDGPLFVRYVYDVPEIANWDEDAANAFAHRLAAKCGRRIAGSAFDANAAWQAYQQVLGRAKHVDAGENPPIQQEDGSWITARWGWGFWR
jgi:hypothetical protein